MPTSSLKKTTGNEHQSPNSVLHIKTALFGIYIQGYIATYALLLLLGKLRQENLILKASLGNKWKIHFMRSKMMFSRNWKSL